MMMIKRFGILLIFAAAAACESPTEPTKVTICKTKPRMYCSADASKCWFETDTYLSTEGCPKEPIE